MKKWLTLLLASTLMLTACGKSNEKASLEKSINQLEKETYKLKKINSKISKIVFRKILMNCLLKILQKNHLKRANQILVRKMVQTRHLLTIQNNQQKHRSQINLKHHLRTLSSPVNRIKMLIKKHRTKRQQIKTKIQRARLTHNLPFNQRLMVH